VKPEARVFGIIGIAVGVGLLGIGAFAQVDITPRPKSPAPGSLQTGRSDIRVDSHLVLVPVSVNDDFNRPITGLEKENFRVFEDKVEHPIVSFSSEDEPIALGFIFDTSGSMKYAIPEGRHAAAEFLKLADPKDEFFLVEFDSRPRLTVPLSGETEQINTEVLFTKSGGSTALIDALYMGIHEMAKSKKGKKALVLISDDGENNSRYTPTEIRRIVRESDVLIYSVVVAGESGSDQRYGQGLMKEISETSGAHMFYAGTGNLTDIAQKICIELRNRYLLAYVPPDSPRDGRYHHIEVRVVAPRGLPKLRAHWRTGYYAPSD
jgi:Ca-activated chloride channel homolog